MNRFVEIGNKILTYGAWFMIFLAFVFSCFFIQYQCEIIPVAHPIVKPEFIQGETIITNTPGIPDTTIKKDSAKVIIHNIVINDSTDKSIIIDSVMYKDSLMLKYKLTTIPAIDSFALALDFEIPVKEIVRVDTLSIMRVDTLKLTEIMLDKSGNLESFGYGAGAGSLITVLLIILL